MLSSSLWNWFSYLRGALVWCWMAYVLFGAAPSIGGETEQLEARVLWRYLSTKGSCEIAAYDPASKRLFLTLQDGICVLDARSGVRGSTLDRPDGFHATSVACRQGRVAVAWAAYDKHLRGKISVYDANSLKERATFSAGYLPDMVVFSPDGRYLLAANEAEPTDDYNFDPEASITVVDFEKGLESAELKEVDFKKFNTQREELRKRGVRLCGPSQVHSDGQATTAEDLEPEYIAVGKGSQRVWITLQENNALAELDLKSARIVAIHPLGLKNFRKLSDQGSVTRTTGLDASDKDGGCRIRHWPILGLFQPDGIALFQHAGATYLLTANEGDPRNYGDYDEKCAVAKLVKRGIDFDDGLSARHFLSPDQLGRLEVSAFSGDTDSDGDLDELHCFGTRSFGLWQVDAVGGLKLVFDSGSDFERVTASELADRFNATSKPDGRPDERSTSRGPEPETVIVGQVGKHRLAMIGLERTGGVMIYDLSFPTQPTFVKYLPPLNDAGILDCSPEGLLLIPSETSPTGKPCLIVCNEGSGTTTVYELQWSQNQVALNR